jgi:hypothetical protein
MNKNTKIVYRIDTNVKIFFVISKMIAKILNI